MALEKASEKDPGLEGLVLQLQRAVIALETKQIDTVIGNYIFLSNLPHIYVSAFSPIVRRASMASHSRHGEERLRNNLGLPTKLLQDFEKLYGGKVQEGNHHSPRRLHPAHLRISLKPQGQEHDEALHKVVLWPRMLSNSTSL